MNRRTLVILSFLLTIVACISLWQATSTLQTWERVGLVIGAASLLVAMFQWLISELVKPKEQPAINADEDRRNLLILNDSVKRNWIDGVLNHSIYNQLMLDIHKTTVPNAVNHPWSRVTETDHVKAIVDSGKPTTEVFDAVGKKLLILGEPGAGKSTELLVIARYLIDQAEKDKNAAIPVVLNLSTWAVGQLPLKEWVINELDDKYGVKKKRGLGKRWLEENRLILLLDGLDEVAEGARLACLAAINTFIEQEGIPNGLVVCSRIKDFEALERPLNLDCAIKLQPLTDEQLKQFLLDPAIRPTIPGLIRALTEDNELREADENLRTLAETPLMLSIMCFAYKGMGLSEVTQGDLQTIEARRSHIFQTYIENMFERKGERESQYSSDTIKRWLVWLARRMNQNEMTLFHIENIQLSWLRAKPELQKYRLFFWLLIVFLLSLSGLPTLVFGDLLKTLTTNFMMVLAFVFYFKSRYGLSHSTKISPKEVLVFSPNKPRLYMAQVAFLVGFLGVMLQDELYPRFFIRFPIGLAGGLVMGLWSSLSSRLINSKFLKSKKSPNEGIFLSFRNSLFVGLTIGLSVFLSILFVEVQSIDSLMTGSSVLIPIGLSMSLAVGLSGGLFFGGEAVVKHFLLRILLKMKKYSPWNYAKFLNYSSDLIFLNKVGGGYRFIHRLLQDHFAAMYDDYFPEKKA